MRGTEKVRTQCALVRSAEFAISLAKKIKKQTDLFHSIAQHSKIGARFR